MTFAHRSDLELCQYFILVLRPSRGLFRKLWLCCVCAITSNVWSSLRLALYFSARIFWLCPSGDGGFGLEPKAVDCDFAQDFPYSSIIHLFLPNSY